MIMEEVEIGSLFYSVMVDNNKKKHEKANKI